MQQTNCQIDQQIIDFYYVLGLFKQANEDYEKKIELMKELWGNITQSQTVNYTKNHFVVITIDNKNKYNFEFNGIAEPGTPEFELFISCFPELKEETEKLIKDAGMNVSNQKEIEQEPELVQISEQSDYLNLYKGIKIEKK